MRTYDQVRQQWETLWAISAANDMTGGYVDQQDLAKLLKSPTKATARDCMERQIEYWFYRGPDPLQEPRSVSQIIDDNPEVRVIAEDYGYA